jgi:PAS domain S-box-containing protein
MSTSATKLGVSEGAMIKGSDKESPRSPDERRPSRAGSVRLPLELIPAAAYTCDTNGLITDFNRRAAQAWGREPKLNDPVDRFCGSFRLSTADGSPVSHDRCWMALALQQKQGFNEQEIVVERPDGSRITVLAHVNPLYDESGRMVGAVNILVDITDRKRTENTLRDSEVRYRRLFQTAKDGILILDATTGKIIDTNAFMSGLLGRDPHELLGKELYEIGMFEDEHANKAAFAELQQSGYIRYDNLPVQKPNGEITQVEFVSNVYRENDTLVAQCNVRDISARVEMDRKIAQQAETLADHSTRQDEFLAMLSHELRNPLAPIRSATHILKLQGSENALQHHACEVIERQVATLSRLVSDLTEVSRVVSGKIRLDVETTDFCWAVRHALETVRPLMDSQRHEVSLSIADGPIWVSADATRLEQVAVNLLTNAAKFTEAGGRIGVNVEREQNHAVLRVRDSGIGIAPEMLAHVFDLFAQAERSLARSQGGLGIGLSLVQRLITLQGGTVDARSDGPGHGSEFIVRLPVAPVPDEQAAPTPALPDDGGAKGLRVLVVDDNEDGCTMLAEFVRLQGYGAQMAFTGPAALAVAATWRPDVVLLDIGLPELDGFEIARRLRADPATKAMKLIALSGYGSERDIELGREAGFDAHLVKPVDLAEVEKLLASSNQPRSRQARS